MFQFVWKSKFVLSLGTCCSNSYEYDRFVDLSMVMSCIPIHFGVRFYTMSAILGDTDGDTIFINLGKKSSIS
jgi:hypothetical protein